MSDGGGASGTGGPSAASVSALVEAIDARARQAGQESASTLLRGMLGSVSEVLTAIQDRLDHVEELLLGGGGAGSEGSAVVGAVQEGLAAFNTRLARLEEAFVQAVDDSGSGTQAVVDQVRDAVVAAVAAAPAGEPAAPSVEVDLGPLLERLVAIEARVSEPAPAVGAPEVDLEPLVARLSALESSVAALAAVPPPAPVPPVDLRPLESRLAGVEDAVRAPVDLRPVVEHVAPLTERLAGLEQLVRSRADERVDPGASVRAALAPVVERLETLEVALRSASEASADRSGRVEASVAAVPARLAAMEERLSTLSAAVAAVPAGLDPAAVERLESAVEHLRRDEASAQLVGLVEERLAAGMRAMTERADTVRRMVDELAGASRSDGARFDQLEALVRSSAVPPDAVARSVAESVAGRWSAMGDRLSGLDARLDGVDARLAGVDDNVAAVHAQLEPLASVQRGLRATADKLVEVGDQIDVIERLANDLGSLPGALATLQDRLGEVLGRPTSEEVLAGLADKVDELLARPPVDDKLDQLLSRPASDDGLASKLDELLSRPASDERLLAKLDELLSRPPVDEGLAAKVDELLRRASGAAALLAKVDELMDRRSGDEAIAEKLDQLLTRPPAPALPGPTAGAQDTTRITDAIRAEAELLTQRVAALAVGVEAARSLLEQHVADTEHGVGRKATDFGRKIAADFGIRPGRRGSGRGGRDPRELPPG